jgi:AcrR family transcriptional regulator
MSVRVERSRKGELRAQEVIEAAMRCLGRDGYAGTSLQRVADEAGVSKRNVIYYYGCRERLFDEVVRYVGGRLIARVAEAVAGLEEPADIVSRGFDQLWGGLTTDRPLLVAWFGLRTEAITNPALRETAAWMGDGFRRLLSGLIDDALSRGRTLLIDRGALEVLIMAGVQGLVLEYLERGESPELAAAIADLQRLLGLVSLPPGAV